MRIFILCDRGTFYMNLKELFIIILLIFGIGGALFSAKNDTKCSRCHHYENCNRGIMIDEQKIKK